MNWNSEEKIKKMSAWNLINHFETIYNWFKLAMEFILSSKNCFSLHANLNKVKTIRIHIISKYIIYNSLLARNNILVMRTYACACVYTRNFCSKICNKLCKKLKKKKNLFLAIKHRITTWSKVFSFCCFKLAIFRERNQNIN